MIVENQTANELVASRALQFDVCRAGHQFSVENPFALMTLA